MFLSVTLQFMSQTILAIDPGFDRVGWAVGNVERGKLNILQYGCIQTLKTENRFQRYSQIQVELSAIIDQHVPNQAAIETLFFSKNQTTAMHVSEARGVIISTLLHKQIEIFEYNPNEIKLAVTGYGKADKSAVEKMVRLQLGAQLTQKEKIIDDTMDALGILLTHSLMRKMR